MMIERRNGLYFVLCDDCGIHAATCRSFPAAYEMRDELLTPTADGYLCPSCLRRRHAEAENEKG